MATLTYYTATTLDGFIADPDDSLAWLFAQGGEDAGEATAGNPLGYHAFIAGIGAIVMGSTTYEWVMDYEQGRWPYRLPAWVMTSRELAAPPGADVRFASGDVRPVHAAMAEAASGEDLWVVGGGDLAGQFADAGLLDEVITFQAPVTLGAGRPLLPRRLQLRPIETHADAFVATRYAVVGAGEWT
jgi:dihydrofolate reductase